MQILTGSKRDIAILEWQEQIEKHMKRLNNSMECFRRFHEASDLEHMLEDIQELQLYVSGCKKVIERFDYMGIK